VESGIQVGVSTGLSVAGLAQVEASIVASDRLETHHILLALLTGPSLACRALVSHGVTHGSVEAAVLRGAGVPRRVTRDQSQACLERSAPKCSGIRSV
jgi:hypothetical protein